MDKPEIQKSDTTARRNAIIILLFGSLFGLVVIYILKSNIPAFQEWLLNDTTQLKTKINIISAVIAVFFLPTLFFAFYFWRIGTQTITAKIFPPPNTKVIKDKYILRGQAAIKRGKLIKTFAVITLLMSLIIPILMRLLIWQTLLTLLR